MTQRTSHELDWTKIKETHFTEEEWQELDVRATVEVEAMLSLEETLAKAVAEYIAKEDIEISEFAERLGVSPHYATRILQGDCDLSLITIAEIGTLIGKRPVLSFEPLSESLRSQIATI